MGAGEATRPKRQDDIIAEETPEEAPAPIDDAYAKRLEGSAIALANKLANAKRQRINRVTGYGRKKRQARAPGFRNFANSPSLAVGAVTPSRSGGSPGYGRKRRQISAVDDLVLLQEISEIKAANSKSSEII